MVKNSSTPSSGSGICFIVVAAGRGERFGSAIPKQFLPLAGQPVLVRTVAALHAALPEASFVLVLSEQGEDIWRTLCPQYPWLDELDLRVARGGATRSDSVAAAIGCLPDQAHTVMVHDGARPLVEAAVVQALADELARPGVDAAVPVTPLTEAVAAVTADDTVVPSDRDALRTVQTPQAFGRDIFERAYQAAAGKSMPDDAAVVSAFGVAIHTVPGSVVNIKITNPKDIAIAEMLLC